VKARDGMGWDVDVDGDHGRAFRRLRQDPRERLETFYEVAFFVTHASLLDWIGLDLSFSHHRGLFFLFLLPPARHRGVYRPRRILIYF